MSAQSIAAQLLDMIRFKQVSTAIKRGRDGAPVNTSTRAGSQTLSEGSFSQPRAPPLSISDQVSSGHDGSMPRQQGGSMPRDWLDGLSGPLSDGLPLPGIRDTSMGTSGRFEGDVTMEDILFAQSSSFGSIGAMLHDAGPLDDVLGSFGHSNSLGMHGSGSVNMHLNVLPGDNNPFHQHSVGDVEGLPSSGWQGSSQGLVGSDAEQVWDGQGQVGRSGVGEDSLVAVEEEARLSGREGALSASEHMQVAALMDELEQLFPDEVLQQLPQPQPDLLAEWMGMEMGSDRFSMERGGHRGAEHSAVGKDVVVECQLGSSIGAGFPTPEPALDPMLMKAEAPAMPLQGGTTQQQACLGPASTETLPQQEHVTGVVAQGGIGVTASSSFLNPGPLLLDTALLAQGASRDIDNLVWQQHNADDFMGQVLGQNVPRGHLQGPTSADLPSSHPAALGSTSQGTVLLDDMRQILAASLRDPQFLDPSLFTQFREAQASTSSTGCTSGSGSGQSSSQDNTPTTSGGGGNVTDSSRQASTAAVTWHGSRHGEGQDVATNLLAPCLLGLQGFGGSATAHGFHGSGASDMGASGANYAPLGRDQEDYAAADAKQTASAQVKRGVEEGQAALATSAPVSASEEEEAKNLSLRSQLRLRQRQRREQELQQQQQQQHQQSNPSAPKGLRGSTSTESKGSDESAATTAAGNAAHSTGDAWGASASSAPIPALLDKPKLLHLPKEFASLASGAVTAAMTAVGDVVRRPHSSPTMSTAHRQQQHAHRQHDEQQQVQVLQQQPQLQQQQQPNSFAASEASVLTGSIYSPGQGAVVGAASAAASAPPAAPAQVAAAGGGVAGEKPLRPVRTPMEQALMACARAVEQRDLAKAHSLMAALAGVVSPHGTAEQRCAYYFLEGLAARIVGTGSSIYKALQSQQGRKPGLDGKVLLRAFLAYFEATPWVYFGHTVCNNSILEAVADATDVHVIDFGITFGTQWPTFIEQLAVRRGGPPNLRLTMVDCPNSGLKPSTVQETGRRLATFADAMAVPFEFTPITQNLESLQASHFELRPKEVLAVSGMLRLHQLEADPLEVEGDERAQQHKAPPQQQSQRNTTLKMIASLRPKIVALVEQHAEHNDSSFLFRFREVLHYWSAHFDAIGAALPSNSDRALVEERVFGRKIINMVACEGEERVERHESFRQWRMRMETSGFKGRLISADVIDDVKLLLRRFSDSYGMESEGDALFMTWKGLPYFAASTWECAKL